MMLVDAARFSCWRLYEKQRQAAGKGRCATSSDTLVRRPKARPYRTNNVYGALMRQEAIDKEVQKLSARKLTREEKEHIKAVIRKNRPNGRQPGSAQETIPYDRIWPDGICLAQWLVHKDAPVSGHQLPAFAQ